MHGPLVGLKVVELGGIGPGPHAAMMLADLGADVVRIDRPGQLTDPELPRDQLLRGRRIMHADLKAENDLREVLTLVQRADVLLEGFRPGVVERLGIGPEIALKLNPRLVYARMTGWGQDGPLSQRAGHDINYIATTGALHAIGRKDERPVPPLNLAGDFGGGSMFLVVGVLAALFETNQSGRGQVVDAAMVDGCGILLQMVRAMYAAGIWRDERGSNMFDGGAPYYDTYTCKDGRHVAVGALEPQFYAELLRGLELTDACLPQQDDEAGWPVLRGAFTEAFASRTRDEWAAVFADRDACVSPVLSIAEAPDYPHASARDAYVRVDGVTQPAPAPRFSRTPTGVPSSPPIGTVSAGDVLDSWRR